MKRYIRATSNYDDEYISTIRNTLLPYVGKDVYVKVKYFDGANRHPNYSKSLYIKISKVTNKTCEARCYDGMDIYLPMTNRDNVFYPPQYCRLALNRIGIPDDMKAYTFEELCALPRKSVNMPSADQRNWY